MVWATHFAYDADGLLQEVRDNELGPIRYDYDADGRLTAQHGPRAQD